MPETSTYNPWQHGSPSRRRFRRWFVDMPTVFYIAGAPLPCIIQDLTPVSAGIQLGSAEEVSVGTKVALDLGGLGTVQARVQSRDRRHVGLEFIQQDQQAVQLAEDLLDTSPERRLPRLKTNLKAHLIVGADAHACVIEDISRLGACVVMARTPVPNVGDEVTLRRDTDGDATASVRWVSELRVGFMFLQIVTTAAQAGPLADLGDNLAASGDDFLPGLKRAIEDHIKEQLKRETRGEVSGEWERVIDALISKEMAKLAKLESRFAQDGDHASGSRVRELIDSWLLELAREFKRRK